MSSHPIRIFHGISDDYVPIAPCRQYFERLQQSSKNVKLVAFPDTWHAFDFPNLPTAPTVAQNAQTTLCSLVEGPVGTMINAETAKPFTYNDGCVGRNPHTAYSATSTHATEDAVKMLLKEVFELK